jgi:hypothetical protein
VGMATHYQVLDYFPNAAAAPRRWWW